jgi:hypothetical protein
VGAAYVDPMLLFSPVDLAAVVHLAAPRGGPAAAGTELSPDAGSPGERSAIVGALRVDTRAAVPPPKWWAEAQHDVPTEAEAPVGPSRPVAEAKHARPTRPPGSVTAAVAGTVISVGGFTVARRRWRARGS